MDQIVSVGGIGKSESLELCLNAAGGSFGVCVLEASKVEKGKAALVLCKNANSKFRECFQKNEKELPVKLEVEKCAKASLEMEDD